MFTLCVEFYVYKENHRDGKGFFVFTHGVMGCSSSLTQSYMEGPTPSASGGDGIWTEAL